MTLLSRGMLLIGCSCGRVGFDAARVDSDADAVPADVAADGQPAICHTGAWGMLQPIAATVTGSEESDPSVTGDERTLFFESNRSPSLGRAIWVSTRASTADAFGAPMLVPELDDATDDYDPDIAADGTILFGSLRSGTRQIHVAKRANDTSPFTNITQLNVVNDSVIKSGPRMTSGGLALYYGRDLEVAYATRANVSDDFTFVRELDEVNAPPTDGSPTITADGLEMFFDSYRNGPAAIFHATRTDATGMFSGLTELTELVTVVPNATGAGTPEISADGHTLYYFLRVNNQLDLYTATRVCN